jgi:hypothetical protein
MKSFHQAARDGDRINEGKCELCNEILTEENTSDNANRCNDCYEEWGDRYPDE